MEQVLDRKTLYTKLTDARTSILTKYPFFGSLVMHLKLSLANVETAATDMRRIMWDPHFLMRLSSEEVEFVMMHEIMHCVLQHCMRGKELEHYRYNLACDIVVNSTILEYIKLPDFIVDGELVKHNTPLGTEGYEHTVEQVYDMLQGMDCVGKQMSVLGNQGECDNASSEGQTSGKRGTLDNHNVWDMVSSKDKYLEEQWKEQLLEATRKGNGYSPCGSAIRKLVEDYEYQAKVDWKTVLHEFIQVVHDKRDYTFSPYDRRFAHTDFLLPAFNEIETERISNLWFLVDASGSISDEVLGLTVSEIKASVEQFESLSGRISFFDTVVSEPMEFSDEVRFPSIEITGGGGTSFYAIFRYMQEYMRETLPTAVIILTDGLAEYPPEEIALDVPVLWILIDNQKDTPWGMCTHIVSEKLPKAQYPKKTNYRWDMMEMFACKETRK